MSNARKLQTEIDRVMKKVDEGCDLFDEIWLKVKNAEAQNLKEKFEDGLKKEIKKLQRLRDQIKTWIGSSDVKDKDALIEARKRIETKMEQFKICEKETKTKTYSKEGLAREDKLDPVEEAKLKTTSWIADYIEKFQQIVEEKDFEIEKLSSGKGKKTNKHQIEELQAHITNHKYHISKLEGIIRLVNNDVLDVEPVDQLKEDLDYYLEEYEDEDYMTAYDEEIFYESLGLEDLDVVNVDRVTQPPVPNKKAADDTTSTTSSRGTKESKAKKNSISSVIPLTIGRARSKAEKKAEREREKEENERNAASTPSKAAAKSPSTSAAPAPATAKAPPAAPAPGASMAAILKRETEQQEKERQKALKEQQLRQQQAAQLKQQEQLRQQEALRQQQQQQQAQQEALQRQQQQEALRQQQAQQQAQQEAAAKQQQAAAQLQAQQRAAAEQKAIQNQQIQQQQQQQSQGGQGGNALDILTTGLGGLGLSGTDSRSASDSSSLQLGSGAGGAGGNAPSAGSGASNPSNAPTGNLESAGSSYLTALNESFVSAPATGDNERSRQYTPQNPYPTPASYPGTPSAIFENPAVFEKLGTDCLFFIFYYAQGTYQQYLAARELKKQSWRFHKKYMTWFQRHEEPKITTDEYEQGTYVYFDYETGWCTRIKQDFRFEYSFLEDSLQ